MRSLVPRHFRLFTVQLALVAACGPAVAERPSAMKLFPEETLVFVRLADAYEFGQRLQQTATGRMLRDPQLQPLVEQLYGDAAQLYAEEAEERVGISWEDLQRLPRGEVAFGVIARPGQRPALLLLVDQGEEPTVASRLLDRALEVAGERGAEFTSETIGGIEVTIVRDADNQDRMFGVFERDNTIVAATDPGVLRHVLHHWLGEAASAAGAGEDASDAATSNAASDEEFVASRTLAENQRFATIVRECRRPHDPPPHLLFFVDPIELVRNVGRNRGGVQFALGLLPSLGLDGLTGIGGTMTYATGEYDDLTHLHVLLENPRAGVLQLPALKPGDTTPPEFVPHAIETYFSWHWDVRTTYDRIVALVDQFRYEGSVDKIVADRLSDPLGVDFVEQVIDNLGGRFVWLIGYEKPAHFGSQRHVLAAELADEAAAVEALNAVIAKRPEWFGERRFGDVSYYAIRPRGFEELDEAERPIDPFVAIMDGHIFLGGSCQLFERAVAARDGTVDRLADSEEYARTTAVLGRETAGIAPVLFSINRAEETVRHWYELITADETRALIEEHTADNRVLAALVAALDEHQLPPFEVLAGYYAPGGAILYDTDTGYHWIGFTLRSEAD